MRKLVCLFILASVFAWEARANCLFDSRILTGALSKRFKPSVTIIETFGADDSCRDFGTGVIVSVDGVVMTANHVVSKNTCPEPGIFARFSWAPDEPVEMRLVDSSPVDVAFLEPMDSDVWSRRPASLCIIPMAGKEAADEESFIRWGLIPPNMLHFLTGSVIAQSSHSGRPPMQRVCSIMHPGHSGGPVISAFTGEMIGIVNSRIEKDQFGHEVIDQAYILPLAAVQKLKGDRLKAAKIAACPTDDLIEVSADAGGIEVPYQFAVKRGADGGPEPAEVRIFKPLLGFDFDSIQAIQVLHADGSSSQPPQCKGPKTPCIDATIADSHLRVALRNAHAGSGVQVESPIAAVTVLTKQSLYSPELRQVIAGAVPNDVLDRASQGTASTAEVTTVLEALAAKEATQGAPFSVVVSGGSGGQPLSFEVPTGLGGIKRQDLGNMFGAKPVWDAVHDMQKLERGEPLGFDSLGVVE